MVVARASATVRGHVGVVTSAGRVVRAHVQDLPSLPGTAGPVSLAGGAPLGAFLTLERGESVVGLASLIPGAPTLALATASGVIKRVADEPAPNRDAWEVIRLADRRRRRRRPAGLPTRTSWSCSPTTHSSCGSRRPRSARRAARPAGWPGSSSPGARR